MILFFRSPHFQPIRVAVLMHREEQRSKNTGVHLALLAPSQVSIHQLEECPAFDPAKTAVLFPCEEAVFADEVDPSTIEQVVVIDSRWAKAMVLIREDERLKGLRKLSLRDTRTAFWRRKTFGAPKEGVCTVEAVFFLCKALHSRSCLADPSQSGAAASAQPGLLADESRGERHRSTPAAMSGSECHHFDNLLWYFQYQVWGRRDLDLWDGDLFLRSLYLWGEGAQLQTFSLMSIVYFAAHARQKGRRLVED